jgi:hypothetical protein
MENAHLWRRVMNSPPRYVPQPFPLETPATAARGKWITDGVSGEAFFIPNDSCGGVPSRVWVAEALKHVDTRSSRERSRGNTKMALQGAAKLALFTVLAAGCAMGGGAPPADLLEF